jgi:hypothetical protein
MRRRRFIDPWAGCATMCSIGIVWLLRAEILLY